MSIPLRSGDPRKVGPYRLHERLGRGGMGTVFLGRSPGGHTVAVKVVNPDLAEDPGFRKRFATEVAAARRVGGFYTAQVLDSDTDADRPWLATAYIPGPSLYEVVEEHEPLPLESVAALGAGLAEGLAAIHACNLVHRDLKPANVILAADGPRVIDFGIARALDTTSHTTSRAVLGTAAFMAPEQARAEEISPATDVFALGCVLAYATTDFSPFGEGRPDAVAYRVVHEKPDLSGVPATLTRLLTECLAKKPEQRPSLDRVLQKLNALAGPATDRAEGHWLPSAITDVITHRTTAISTLPPTRHLPSPPETNPGTRVLISKDPPPRPNQRPSPPPSKVVRPDPPKKAPTPSGGAPSAGATRSPSDSASSTTSEGDSNSDGGGWLWAVGIGIAVALYLFHPGFSTWASEFLNDGTDNIEVDNCVAYLEAGAAEVPCFAAAADYTVAGLAGPIAQTVADVDDDPMAHECDEVAGWDQITGSSETDEYGETLCLVPTQ